MQEQDIPSKPEWSVIPDHARHVMLCTGPRCTQRGALRLWKTVRNELLAAGRMETVGGVLLTRTHCQFPCNLGPVATVYPDRCWYRIASHDDARRLVREHLLDGRPVSELLLNGDSGCNASSRCFCSALSPAPPMPSITTTAASAGRSHNHPNASSPSTSMPPICCWRWTSRRQRSAI